MPNLKSVGTGETEVRSHVDSGRYIIRVSTKSRTYGSYVLTAGAAGELRIMRDRWTYRGWMVAALLAIPSLGMAQTPAGIRLIVNTVSNSIKVNIGGKAPEPSVRVLTKTAARWPMRR